MAPKNKSFIFTQCVNIIKATGKKAADIHELRVIIADISEESIFHHTCQYFLKEHVLEYTNDFAHWAGESLEERSMAEHLSNIDPYEYRNMPGLRNELLRVIDDYTKKFPEPRRAIPGDEFYFNETVTLTFPVGIRAQNLAEFLLGIRFIDAQSIYYHFYEARMRLRNGVDDFYLWMEQVLGKRELAERIRAIDPFMHHIEGIRDFIVTAVEKEVKNEMGVIH